MVIWRRRRMKNNDKNPLEGEPISMTWCPHQSQVPYVN
uniref:Uncharacterized protein n=1 Tax=Anguilla anguilla TaxID=7936 RepID=A0A0E9UXA7_ANGAN